MAPDDFDRSSLNDLYNANRRKTWLEQRFALMRARIVREEAPPFPRQLSIETTNICNHRCSFCAYATMSRPARQMDPALFRRLVSEAYDLGTREVGLFAGAEPLTCKDLLEHVRYCKSVGYDYVYISTNGSIGTVETYRRLVDAGLDSIKFSINGAPREVYRLMHGRDDFDTVIDNVRGLADYIRSLDRHVFIGVSSVQTEANAGTVAALESLLGGVVDEISSYQSNNQAGQMANLPPPPFEDCENPFAKLHISREGYLRACCNDYDNSLAVEDLNRMSLADAWNSARFRAFRRRHLERDFAGTRCDNCLNGCSKPATPLNPDLAHRK